MANSVTKRSDPDRFEIQTDDAVAGFAQYVDPPGSGQRVIFHTKIDHEFDGRGLGSEVVREALDMTRQEGLRVVPVCPFVKEYVKEHPEYGDLVDPVTPAALAAIPR